MEEQVLEELRRETEDCRKWLDTHYKRWRVDAGSVCLDLARRLIIMEGIREELTEARAESDKYRELIEGNARDVLVRELHFENGAMDTYLQHPLFTLFASQTADMFIDNGATNFLEMRMWAEKTGFLTLTIQKENGKTPRQLKAEAEAERDELRAELGEAGGLIQTQADRIERQQEALKPFAALLQKHHEGKSDNYPVFEVNGNEITVGDLRRADELVRGVGG